MVLVRGVWSRRTPSGPRGGFAVSEWRAAMRRGPSEASGSDPGRCRSCSVSVIAKPPGVAACPSTQSPRRGVETVRFPKRN